MLAQYFLPVSTPDRRVIGTLPIALTTFDGTETSITIAGTVYPLKRVTFDSPRVLGQVIDYMAVDASFSDERVRYKGMPNWLPGVTDYIRVPLAPPLLDRVVGKGDLNLLLEGFPKSVATTAPSVNAPTPSTPNFPSGTILWHANVPFANTPGTLFFDISWAAVFGIDPSEVPAIASVSIGAPTADPGNGLALRAVMVYPSNDPSFVGAVTASRIRVVRLNTNMAVPVGDYTLSLIHI